MALGLESGRTREPKRREGGGGYKMKKAICLYFLLNNSKDIKK
jgi:hypothetical protein